LAIVEGEQWGSQSWLPPPFRRRDPLESGPQASSFLTLFHEISRAEGPRNSPQKPLACPAFAVL
jgi:hypothetical protein